MNTNLAIWWSIQSRLVLHQTIVSPGVQKNMETHANGSALPKSTILLKIPIKASVYKSTFQIVCTVKPVTSVIPIKSYNGSRQKAEKALNMTIYKTINLDVRGYYGIVVLGPRLV